MIRNSTLLKLATHLLELDHETNFGAEESEIEEAITEFFNTDESVVGTENEGKTTDYYEALREMYKQTAEKLDEIWQRIDPDSYDDI